MKPAVIGLAVVLAASLGTVTPSDAGERQRTRPAGQSGGSQAVPRGGDSGNTRSTSPPPRGSAPAPRATAPAPRAAAPARPRATAPADSGTSSNDAQRARRAPQGDRDRSGTAVARGDRPRDGRYPTGQAVPRTRPPYSGPTYARPGGWYGYPSWYYRPSYWYGYGALGLGYFYYDPFWYGGYSGYGYGYPSGYYGGGYYGSGGGYYGAYGGGSSSSSNIYGLGKLRLKVKPRDAEVYVDGYYVGLVDDFDGTFQRLTLDAGPHRIEIRKPGFNTVTFDVQIPDDETVTWKGRLTEN
jgi:hypothetical protein